MGFSNTVGAGQRVEHSPLSRDGVGVGNRFCICIYRPAREERWSCVIFEDDRLFDVRANAFASDIQALLSANLKLATEGYLVDDTGG